MICFCNVSKAQNTFEKVIDTLGSAGATCIQETFDGGYVYCSSTNLSGNTILISKIDSIGTIQWVKYHTSGGLGFSNSTYIEQTQDSGYIVNGSYDIGPNTKSWLLRLDANGDTLWTKTFSAGISATQPSENNSMAVYNNAVYGLTGYYKTPVFPLTTYAFFIGTLSNGTLLATKLYDTTSYGTGAAAISKTNNGFIIGGVRGDTNGVSSDCYLVRTNAYGDTIWTKTYDYSQSDGIKVVEQTTDDGFISGGLFANPNIGNQHNIFLMKTNSGGDTLWVKFYGQNFVENIYSLQQTSDGGFILTGYTNDTLAQNSDLFLVKTDSVGNVIWRKLYGGAQGDVGTYVKQTKDGGYIVCGLNNSVGVGGTYIIKTDSVGVILTGFENPEHNNQINLSVYPNPANDQFTIRAKNILKKNAEIAVYTMTGICVYAGNLKNNELKKINAAAWAAGLYTLVLKADDKMLTKKIAVLKNNVQ